MTNKLRRYHAAVWDEPLVMEMGVNGRRGCLFPSAGQAIDAAVGPATELVPAAMRRTTAPVLPEVSEPDVLRHYLHLSQQTLGMMGISLFGTCTMKYNPRLTESLAARPWIADLHPAQHPSTLQGFSKLPTGSTSFYVSCPGCSNSLSSPPAVPTPLTHMRA